MRNSIRFTGSALALLTAVPAVPAVAQSDNVEVLANWNYSTLYASGWSVEKMFDSTEVINAEGEVIGDIENVIFSNEGEVLGIIAEVGGFWDILDTHVYVSWDRVEFGDNVSQITVPVTEETIDDYDVFGDYWFEESLLTDAETETIGPIDDDLATGPDIFRATDLIGDYVYLSDGMRYGYIADIIIENSTIAAIVTDAAAYGRGGYYAYPYSYRGVSPYAGSRYVMPYTAPMLDTIENFDYDQLQTRPDQ